MVERPNGVASLWPKMALTNYDATILATSGLQHYYKLGEKSGNFADSQGSETLTAAGTIAYAASSLVDNDLGGAMDTTGGTTGQASVTGHTAVGGASDFTYEFIFRFTDTSLNVFFLNEGSGASTTQFIGVGTDTVTAGKLRYSVRNNSNVLATATSASAYNDGKHHICWLQANRTANTVDMWIDDPVNVASTQQTYPAVSYTLNQFAVGGLFRTSFTNALKQIVSRVAVYNVALSQVTRTAHVNAAFKGNPSAFF